MPLFGRPMPRFVHHCKPCDTCGSTGRVNVGDEIRGDEDGECSTCEGQSTPCRCEDAYDREAERRYSRWKDGD